jgi:hypothetical protein
LNPRFKVLLHFFLPDGYDINRRAFNDFLESGSYNEYLEQCRQLRAFFDDMRIDYRIDVHGIEHYPNLAPYGIEVIQDLEGGVSNERFISHFPSSGLFILFASVFRRVPLNDAYDEIEMGRFIAFLKTKFTSMFEGSSSILYDGNIIRVADEISSIYSTLLRFLTVICEMNSSDMMDFDLQSIGLDLSKVRLRVY